MAAPRPSLPRLLSPSGLGGHPASTSPALTLGSVLSPPPTLALPTPHPFSPSSQHRCPRCRPFFAPPLCPSPSFPVALPGRPGLSVVPYPCDTWPTLWGGDPPTGLTGPSTASPASPLSAASPPALCPAQPLSSFLLLGKFWSLLGSPFCGWAVSHGAVGCTGEMKAWVTGSLSAQLSKNLPSSPVYSSYPRLRSLRNCFHLSLSFHPSIPLWLHLLPITVQSNSNRTGNAICIFWFFWFPPPRPRPLYRCSNRGPENL